MSNQQQRNTDTVPALATAGLVAVAAVSGLTETPLEAVWLVAVPTLVLVAFWSGGNDDR